MKKAIILFLAIASLHGNDRIVFFNELGLKCSISINKKDPQKIKKKGQFIIDGMSIEQITSIVIKHKDVCNHCFSTNTKTNTVILQKDEIICVKKNSSNNLLEINISKTRKKDSLFKISSSLIENNNIIKSCAKLSQEIKTYNNH